MLATDFAKIADMATIEDGRIIRWIACDLGIGKNTVAGSIARSRAKFQDSISAAPARVIGGGSSHEFLKQVLSRPASD